ncbi:MAG: hypothetical protein K2H64_01485 [Desulfovibrio sp.]|nr:hypothetical protein [Desulfovibrio sp.]
MGGEALPLLIDAIKKGLATDDLILTSARLAYEYYDHDLATAVLRGLKQSRKK